MLEQNTDRLMAVVAALAIGALLVAFAPQLGGLFDTVLEAIEKAIGVATGAGK